MRLPFQLPLPQFLRRGFSHTPNESLEGRGSTLNSKRSGSIVIFGQYKSGTTALFCQIRHAIYGHEVRELFEPKEYVETAGDANRWLLAKVILRFDSTNIRYDSFANFQKKVIIYRDPRDWLISTILFTFQQPHFALYRDTARFETLFDLLRKKESDPGIVKIFKFLRVILYEMYPQGL
jgi:hypothetical protein